MIFRQDRCKSQHLSREGFQGLGGIFVFMVLLTTAHGASPITFGAWKKLHSILFSLHKPKDENRAKLSDWSNATHIVESNVEQNSAVESIGRGAWLLTGGDALPLFAQMIRAADDYHIPYRVLFVQAGDTFRREVS